MPKIILAGNDFRLLVTRAAVLGRTGASVVCCSAAEALGAIPKEKFDLAVLCHTISDDDAHELSEVIHRLWPKTKILRVVSNVAPDMLCKGAEFDAISAAEPRRLIRRTSEMLEMLPTHDPGETTSGARIS
jgi:CheY-like chemotaxis protein